MLSKCDPKHFKVDIVAAEICPSVFTETLANNGIRFIELSGNQKLFIFNWILFRRLLKKTHYDSVHLNLFHGMSLHYARIAKQEGVPIRIAHSHNSELRKSFFRPFKLVLHRIFVRTDLSCATHLWACSEAAADFLFYPAVFHGRGIQIIPNGIDTERFRFRSDIRIQKRDDMGLSEKFIIGHVGRMCYQKNQSFLLDIMAVMHRTDAVLLLVGTGEDLDELKSKANDLGISDRVIFYGSSKMVEELLWAMDVFVLPSKFEGLPVTLVEAQSAGLYCIVSDKVSKESDLTDIVCFIPCDDPLEWVDALESVRFNEERSAYAGVVRSAGFDIADISSMILNHYCRFEK